MHLLGMYLETPLGIHSEHYYQVVKGHVTTPNVSSGLRSSGRARNIRSVMSEHLGESLLAAGLRGQKSAPGGLAGWCRAPSGEKQERIRVQLRAVQRQPGLGAGQGGLPVRQTDSSPAPIVWRTRGPSEPASSYQLPIYQLLAEGDGFQIVGCTLS